MPRHEHFEELCGLAVLGELSSEELAELTLHMRDCDACRAAYTDFSVLASEHMSVGHRGTTDAPISKLRAATLERMAAEGLRISPEALQGNTREPWQWPRWRLPQVAAAVCLIALIAGGAWIVRRDASQRQELQRLQASLLDAQRAASQFRRAMEPAPVNPSRDENADAARNIAVLGEEIRNAKAQAAQLDVQRQRDADAIRALEGQVAQLTSEKAALGQRASTSDADLAGVRGQLEQLRAAAAERESQSTTQQARAAERIKELSDQLGAEQALLERERGLLAAGRDVRDLMAARNLHIIDVHDQDAHGESRPFGRIFLTEGKRLIFYAYDLDSVTVKNASFQAWGQRDDGNKTAVNLGIFYVDDQKQSRWSLKVEDPNLLKAIDSVFVTVEPSGGTKKPSGKKLMYAYLRNPINHP